MVADAVAVVAACLALRMSAPDSKHSGDGNGGWCQQEHRAEEVRSSISARLVKTKHGVSFRGKREEKWERA